MTDELERLRRLHEVATERTVQLAAVIAEASAAVEFSSHPVARILHSPVAAEILAAHDREVAASAIEQAANRITGLAWPPIREQLDVYAQTVREGDAVRQWGSDA